MDLVFFNYIQDLQHDQLLKNIDYLVAATEGTLSDMDSAKLNNIFLSYNLAMESATKIGGGNNYKLQNTGKAKLWREERLSIYIKCSDEGLYIANAHLNVRNDNVVWAIPDGMDMLL